MGNYSYAAQDASCAEGALASRPHAVTSTVGATTTLYCYDRNGNMTRRDPSGAPVYNFQYDAENRMTAVSGSATASFVYDGDGNRVKSTVGGVTTVHLGAYFEWTGSTSTMKKYYSAGGARVAVRTGASTLSFILSDHLGSTSKAANYDGTPMTNGEVRYKAWGEQRYPAGSSAIPTTYRYTGQRQEILLGGLDGLYFYGSRWYDPSIGRFLSADTIVPGAGNSQAWDRYAYTLNNPLNYTDPTGYMVSPYMHDGDPILTYRYRYVRSVSIYDEKGKLKKPGSNFSQEINGKKGLCGAVSYAALLGTEDPDISANQVVAGAYEAGIDPDYLYYTELEKLVETYDGWSAYADGGNNQFVALSKLSAILNNGQYPITRVNVNGNTGDLSTESTSVEHWLVVTGVFEGVGKVAVYNPYDNTTQVYDVDQFIDSWFMPRADFAGEEHINPLMVVVTPPKKPEETYRDQR